MTRRVLGARLAGALTGAVLLLGLSPTATTAPNPFGDRRVDTTVLLHRDGSYDVTVRQTIELVREYTYTFGGGVHDGFRLADDLTALPPYLRPAYALTSFTVPAGQPVPTEFTRTHHLLEAKSRGTYPAGPHTAEIRYRVTGAALPTRGGWSVHLRLLDTAYLDGERVEIRAEELAASELDLHCVTFPPDSEPCGILSGSTLIDVFENDRDQGVPPEFSVDIRADNSAVPQPAIDTR